MIVFRKDIILTLRSVIQKGTKVAAILMLFNAEWKLEEGCVYVRFQHCLLNFVLSIQSIENYGLINELNSQS